MNREIKFRMWDFANSKFVTDGFSIDMDGWAWHDDNDKSHRLDGSYELMQFTGLKDRNGKDIYEGDIVKGGPYACKPNKKTISLIKYQGNGFWVDSESFGYEGETMWDWEDIEVIGNQYEHPELLTNKAVITTN